MKSRTSHAMTLVEVMITLVIFAVMLEAIYSTLMVSQRTWTNYTQDIAPKQQVRLAMTLMINELREALDVFIVKDEDHIELTFHRPVIGEVKYTWTGSGPDANRVIRANYTQKRVLAFNISSLAFTAPTDGEIVIDIGTPNKNIGLKEKVALRAKTGLFAQSEIGKIK